LYKNRRKKWWASKPTLTQLKLVRELNMPLNLNNSNSFIPHIRWMASLSSWSISSLDGQQPVEWTECLFDLANIKTGWGLFGDGLAPEWIWDVSIQQSAPNPNDGREWKRGFSVNMFSPQQFGGDGIREFATTGVGATMGIGDLYSQYETGLQANKIPVVQYGGAEPLRIGKGNTNKPILRITRWVDRPAALDAVLDTIPSSAIEELLAPPHTAQAASQVVQPPASPTPPPTSEF